MMYRLDMGYRDGVLSGYLYRICGVVTVHAYKYRKDGILIEHGQRALGGIMSG